MKEKRNNRSARKRAVHRRSVLLCAVLVSALCLGTFSFCCTALTAQAREAGASDDERVYCKTGDEIYYSTYNTHYFTIGDNTGYCLQPSVNSPADGYYGKYYDLENYVPTLSGTDEEKGERAGIIRCILWGSYGSPGFEPSQWPSEWYDGSEMNDENYYVLSHLLLAYTFWRDLDVALYGCEMEFIDWFLYNIVGSDRAGHVNPDPTYASLIAADIPSRFLVFFINPGRDTQIMIGWEYRDEPNYVYVKKTADDPGLVDGNNYSLGGAVYFLYTDKACTVRAQDAAGENAVLTTKNTGESEPLQIAEGTYYVKEASASPGFDPDPKVHTVTVSEENTIDDPAVVTSTEPSRYALIEIQKASDLDGITTGSACYSFKNAVYGIYTDAACRQRSATVTTDASGYGISDPLPFGTYYVKEITRPAGYQLDDTAVYGPITLSASSGTGNITVRQNVPETPLFDSLGITISKIDLDTGAASPEGGASLQDAQFTVKHYAGYYSEEDLKDLTPDRTWVIRTLERDDGYAAELSEDCWVSGDPLYCDEAGLTVLPLGTYTIEETGAPEGYLLEGIFSDGSGRTVNAGEIYYTQLTDDDSTKGSGIWLYGGNTYTQSDRVIRGGVRVQKRDLESGRTEPEGKATFENAVFEIINENDYAVLVDGTLFQPGETVVTLITDEAGFASTEGDLLPYGSYLLKETGSPTGNLLGSVVLPAAVSQEFQITTGGEIVDLTEADSAITDQVKRGDFSFRKQDGETQAAMGPVLFCLTSETTGESHLLWTDENGDYSSAAGWTPHTRNTNGGETFEDGIWFYGYADEEDSGVEVDDSLGALPYDTYLLEELPCEANEGRILIRTEFTVYRDITDVGELWGNVDLGTLDNYFEEIDVPEIGTTLVDDRTGEHQAALLEDTDICLTDIISYRGLEVGNTYIVRGILIDRETGEALTDAYGNEVTAESEPFTTQSGNGFTELLFCFRAYELQDTYTVAFEYLYEAETDTLVAEHADIQDEGQTVELVPAVLLIDSEGPGNEENLPVAEGNTVNVSAHPTKTGDVRTTAWIIVIIAAAACVILGIAAGKRRYYDD